MARFLFFFITRLIAIFLVIALIAALVGGGLYLLLS